MLAVMLYEPDMFTSQIMYHNNFGDAVISPLIQPSSIKFDLIYEN